MGRLDSARSQDSRALVRFARSGRAGCAKAGALDALSLVSFIGSGPASEQDAAVESAFVEFGLNAHGLKGMGNLFRGSGASGNKLGFVGDGELEAK